MQALKICVFIFFLLVVPVLAIDAGQLYASTKKLKRKKTIAMSRDLKAIKKWNKKNRRKPSGLDLKKITSENAFEDKPLNGIKSIEL